MAKRLAVTISGAVSLGSYEAGVLFEIIDALKQHNNHPETLATGDFIKIDVITGASAGGMSATILAQKLLFEASSLDGPYTNCLYRPWVSDVSIDGLLNQHGNDNAKRSILSSQLVNDISVRYITARYAAHTDLSVEPHIAGASKISLGLALSNLNGIDYGLDMRPAGQFVYTKHQDQMTIGLDGTNAVDFDTLAQWEPLRRAALSCGAFPFAFSLVDLFRNKDDYPPVPPRVTSINPGQQFTYTDGGVFQNEPLGMAKNLVDVIDQHLNTESRFYLFVSPSSKDPNAVPEDHFHSAGVDYLGVAGRLLTSIFEQSRFQDWIEAGRINSKIDVFNRQAKALRDGLLKPAGDPGNISVASLKPMTDAVLPLLFCGNAVNQSRGITRLKQQFALEYQDIASRPGEATADAFIATLLTLETSAQIGHYDEMQIYGITANDPELASFELAAFAGFFDRSYRDHDYDVGRKKAKEFLQNPAIAGAGEIGPIRYTSQASRKIDASLSGLTLAKMDRAVRERVRDRLRDRIFDVLKEIGVQGFVWGPIVREGLDLALITPKLNDLLKL